MPATQPETSGVQEPGSPSTPGQRAAIYALVLLTFLAWSWWPVLRDQVRGWFLPRGYHPGPVLVVLLLIGLWRRRPHPCGDAGGWSGVVVVLLAGGFRVGGTLAGLEWAAGLGLILALSGIALLCGGSRWLRDSWPVLVVLSLLLPLPETFEHALAEPLQLAVGSVAAWVAQTAGYPAVTSGNLLLLGDATTDVAAQVVGLRDLLPGLALAAAVGLILNRPWWQVVTLLVTAVPLVIVLLATDTALVAVHVSVSQTVPAWLMPWGAWLQTATAAVVFLVELRILPRLLLEPAGAPVGSGSRLKAAMPVVIPSDAAETPA